MQSWAVGSFSYQPVRRTVHFLHLRKNAGTQIKFVAQQINENNENCWVESHKHRVRLNDLPPEAEHFFSIRDPITRFKSAFYSRKRKGQPRIFIDWSPEEKEIFSTFEHANDLAEALFEDSSRGSLAFGAMKAKAAKLTESAVVARPDNAGRTRSALSERSTSQLAWINCQLRAKRETVFDRAMKPLWAQNAPKPNSARALFEVSLQEALRF